ncbi:MULTISPECIES: GIY-YIG nuclease family protein [unclassified Halomonas]|uniref:GIY-YIG nuclease family protein n=1 Tax=unclassified Halomonas TaxID=2609666 RepID=UPI001C95A90A|nr:MULTISPECIES: GIY-YIG nuclease family protein [unclassified Halomonas]MBY5926941.1 GIY-YIG nuclease family protein [Halomonas sp. DP4Y7-2]MBY6233983.1 GIY-YIG nuclease family protein [Halomonas sp. DP4Y7-1]
MEYLNRLITLCETAIAAEPKSEFSVTSFDEVPDIEKGVYIIKEVGGCADRTFQAFVEFKKKRLKACSKVNSPSDVLYVGSSATGLRKRLRQHLVYCPDKTYSLHMYEWFNGHYEICILEYEVSIEVLQLIEDSISHDFHHAFGKKFGNNK